MKDHIIAANPSKGYVEPCFRVQGYSLPCECPRPKRRTTAQEIGYLKANFFSNLGFHKPAVTIFVFDYTQQVSDGKKWDWGELEAEAIVAIK